MKNAARSKAGRSAGIVVKAAQFKAEALAIMRRVQETGEPVTVTSRGKPLVRVEAVREQKARTGYGSMSGTVEFLVSDDEIVSGASSERWGTLKEWDEIVKS